MRLSKLALQNFRAFKDAVVQIPSTGILMIAGANNSGKSALLSGIDAMIGGGFGAETQHYGSDGATQVKASFTLEDSERDSLLEEIAVEIGPDSFREITWTFEYNGSVFVPIQVSTPWLGRQDDVVLLLSVGESGSQTIKVSNLNELLAGAESLAENALELSNIGATWSPPDP